MATHRLGRTILEHPHRLVGARTDDGRVHDAQPLLWSSVCALGLTTVLLWPAGQRVAGMLLKIAWLYMKTGARG
jgi:hypothetical protein